MATLHRKRVGFVGQWRGDSWQLRTPATSRRRTTAGTQSVRRCASTDSGPGPGLRPVGSTVGPRPAWPRRSGGRCRCCPQSFRSRRAHPTLVDTRHTEQARADSGHVRRPDFDHEGPRVPRRSDVAAVWTMDPDTDVRSVAVPTVALPGRSGEHLHCGPALVAGHLPDTAGRNFVNI